jgi:hypothetical protein
MMWSVDEQHRRQHHSQHRSSIAAKEGRYIMFAAANATFIEENANYRVQARRMFDGRMMLGRVQRMARGLRRQPLYLRALAGADHTDRTRYLGVQNVSLDAISGTENRSTEFDANFYPTADHIEERWVNVAIAFLRGIPLPPVLLIKVGNDYYVRDGHHRISVMRALGFSSSEAEVIELQA